MSPDVQESAPERTLTPRAGERVEVESFCGVALFSRGDPVMMMVVPFDGSQSAVRAVDFVADRLAKTIGSRLSVHLINVQRGGAGIAGLVGGDAAEISDRLTKTALEQGKRLLATPIERLEKSGVSVKSTVRVGEPASEIADYVADHNADGVVMGTRGLGAVGGLMLGSVASKVVHLVKVPVTLVK